MDDLRRYVDSLFKDATPTKKSVELKEEMIQNLQDKYNDLISEGKTNEAAYNIAVAGIGDISGLLNELEKDTMPYEYDETFILKVEKARTKSAMLTAIAVMMYILCVLPLIIMSMVGFAYSDQIGVPLMFLMIAGATGLLIYNGMTQPKYGKQQDTVVEEFREWQSDEKERKSLRKAISSAMWSLIVVVYIVVSFWTGAWFITWIIFIMGAAVESLINVFFSIRKRRK